MAFDWDANVEIVFGAQLKIPYHTTRLVKRLAMWQPPQNTLFEIAAKRVCLDDVPDTIRTRAKIAAKDVADYSVIPEDADIDAFYWSDMHDELDEQTKELLEKLLKLARNEDGVGVYHIDGYFDLEYNCEEYFNEAFQLAAGRLFGTDDHGLELIFEHGGCHGEACNGASEQIMMLRVVNQNERGGLDAPRGGVGGIPWGCMATPLPTEVDVNKRIMIETAIEAFGFRVEKAVGWHLVTVASVD